MSITTTISRHGITLPLDLIAALCEKYHVEELSVFGSVLRSDFGPESDIDFLVVFDHDDYGPWMGRLTGLEKHCPNCSDARPMSSRSPCSSG